MRYMGALVVCLFELLSLIIDSTSSYPINVSKHCASTNPDPSVACGWSANALTILDACNECNELKLDNMDISILGYVMRSHMYP
jgi:hypothetical protein